MSGRGCGHRRKPVEEVEMTTLLALIPTTEPTLGDATATFMKVCGAVIFVGIVIVIICFFADRTFNSPGGRNGG